MVERPIKKSERQTVDKPSDGQEEVLETESRPTEDEGRGTTRPVRGKEKQKGKGKGNQQEDSSSRQMNLALARGPKPTKPKPPVIKETEEANTEDSVTEPDQQTTAEG